MKYVFIINPNSGKKELKEELFRQIKKQEGKIDYQIYTLNSAEESKELIKELCNKIDDDIVFVACGGDGTINAVVNGVIGYDNAIVTCFPCGSGNDFVKIYGGKENFLNLDNLINGEETKIDVMRVNDRYALNVTNFGFDAEVCDIANKVRRKKIIGGKRSYTTGIIISALKYMKTRCKVIADGEVLADKEILLCTVANGKYGGGG